LLSGGCNKAVSPYLGSNVKINFNESFKNIASYFFYFDRSDFIYTGSGAVNHLIMSFRKSQLSNYLSNDLSYLKKFAAYGFQHQRLNEEAYTIINSNIDYKNETSMTAYPAIKFKL